jgi:hypothetical protein
MSLHVLMEAPLLPSHGKSQSQPPLDPQHPQQAKGLATNPITRAAATSGRNVTGVEAEKSLEGRSVLRLLHLPHGEA